MQHLFDVQKSKVMHPSVYIYKSIVLVDTFLWSSHNWVLNSFHYTVKIVVFNQTKLTLSSIDTLTILIKQKIMCSDWNERTRFKKNGQYQPPESASRCTLKYFQRIVFYKTRSDIVQANHSPKTFQHLQKISSKSPEPRQWTKYLESHNTI